MKDFIQKINRVQQFITNDVPDVIGKEAVDHYKQSFVDEGFSNRGKKDMPWKEVKRRQNPRKKGRAAATRKILTGETGELADSIDYRRQGNDVAITSDKVYAAVHNEGLRAGRGSGFNMPKRQFIGKSFLLNQKIKDKIGTRIRGLLR